MDTSTSPYLHIALIAQTSKDHITADDIALIREASTIGILSPARQKNLAMLDAFETFRDALLAIDAQYPTRKDA